MNGSKGNSKVSDARSLLRRYLQKAMCLSLERIRLDVVVALMLLPCLTGGCCKQARDVNCARFFGDVVVGQSEELIATSPQWKLLPNMDDGFSLFYPCERAYERSSGPDTNGYVWAGVLEGTVQLLSFATYVETWDEAEDLLASWGSDERRGTQSGSREAGMAEVRREMRQGLEVRWQAADYGERVLASITVSTPDAMMTVEAVTNRWIKGSSGHAVIDEN